MKKTNCLIIFSSVLLVFLLFCVGIPLQADASFEYQKFKTTQINGERISSSSIISTPQNSNEIILREDFTAGVIPPLDPYLGEWEHKITADNATWYIDDTVPYNDPYCATIRRGNYKHLQNEWLITPTLDLSEYNVIHMRFYWYTSHLTAVWNDVMDLTVSASLDGGDTWTILWNEDIFETFVSWTWQDSGEIDLSTYAHQSNVKIGFCYYSNNITDSYAQEFSIDNIEIYGDSGNLICDAGGPYEIAWSWNILYGVQFHGSVTGGQMPYLDWTWDFGDGNISNVRYSPNWKYSNVGTYNVTLIVIDSSNPNHMAYDNTTVKVIETPPSSIEIIIQPAIGLLAEVKNNGNLNVSDLNWTMIIEWGPSKILKREVGNGSISFIGVKSSTVIRCSYELVWLGVLRVTIEVKPLNSYRSEKQQMVIIAGKLVIPI